MRNFPNSLILGYQGQYGSQAISAHKPSTRAPNCVSLVISWKSYATQMSIPGGTTTFNAGVSIDITRQNVTAPLDMVKSVFIDNTGVDRPVYLRAFDTGHTISCPDGFAGWYPVISNGQQFTLYTDNIIPLRDGNESTQLIFSNAPFDTFGQQELNRAQALYRASGSSQYVTPVLGDKLTSGGANLAMATNAGTLSGNNGTPANPVNYDVSAILVPPTPNTQVVMTALALAGSYTSSGWPGGARPSDYIIWGLFNGATLLLGFDSRNVFISGRTQLYNNTGLQTFIDGALGLSIVIRSVWSNPINSGNAGVSMLSYQGTIDAQIAYTQIQLPALS